MLPRGVFSFTLETHKEKTTFQEPLTPQTAAHQAPLSLGILQAGILDWVMTNLDSILKSRDITFPTKVHLVKAMVFPVVMYGCESWTVKKAER